MFISRSVDIPNFMLSEASEFISFHCCVVFYTWKMNSLPILLLIDIWKHFNTLLLLWINFPLVFFINNSLMGMCIYCSWLELSSGIAKSWDRWCLTLVEIIHYFSKAIVTLFFQPVTWGSSSSATLFQHLFLLVFFLTIPRAGHGTCCGL